MGRGAWQMQHGRGKDERKRERLPKKICQQNNKSANQMWWWVKSMDEGESIFLFLFFQFAIFIICDDAVVCTAELVNFNAHMYLTIFIKTH